MRRILSALVLGWACFALAASAAEPLRVFIRAGVKTHGPNQHDHPRFLAEWTKLLGERGMKVDGGMEFPTAAQLDATDVVVFYAADGMKVVGKDRTNFENYLRKGGGLVVIHDAVVSADQHEWAKKVQGGAWVWKDEAKPDFQTKWYEGEVGVYFVDEQHPITSGISNFDWKDEIYYDLDMAPDARILATSFHTVFIIAPQMWTYEQTWEGGQKPYRAFVSLPGHEYDVFNTPHYRAILLRGIAWSARRGNVDEFCSQAELASLKYPEGGPTHPSKAAEKLGVHPDFTINLVTSEPLVEKVISLDWDPRGRLWVAETPEYPGGRTISRNDDRIYPERSRDPEKFKGEKIQRLAKDRVSWLADTDGDGRMDEKHIFAEGLELVTSLVFHKEGVIVAQAPDILWLRDLNGDGRCDMVEGSEKFTLYTGFGTFDTHAVMSNFRWGMDGWVYGAVGYSAGQPKSLDGSKEFGRVTAGIIRFKPDGSAVEQVASGSCNTWGFDFAPDGELFYTTATCGEHFLHVVMPEKALARGNVGGVRSSAVLPDHQKIFPGVKHTRPAYVQIDWVGMFTASAGSAIYNGGAWPERYNGVHFSSETTMSLVHSDFLKPNGVTYTAFKEPGREEAEFVAGTDLWFRPIHTRVGPDGALYVVDFYNQAAIHNDTRGPAHGARNAAARPDRDHHFGRVWRIQHKEAKRVVYPELAPANPSGLMEALGNDNGWVRDTAARLLREQGAAAPLAALAELAENENAKAHGRVAALQTLQALGAAEDSTLVAGAQSADPVVRKIALRVISERDNHGKALDLEMVRARINDEDPRARLNALLALATCDISQEVAAEVVSIWPGLDDKHLQSAVVGVAAGNPLMFVDAAFSARDSARFASLAPHLVRLIANKQDAALAAKLVGVIAQEPASSDALKQAALETLAATLRQDVKLEWNDALKGAFKAMLASGRPGLPGAALPLIARWDTQGSLAADLKPVVQQLGAKLGDAALSDADRGQVAVNLVGVRNLDASILPNVGALLHAGNSLDLQRRVINALSSVNDAGAGAQLIAAWSKVSPELRDAMFDALFKRVEWSDALVEALRAKTLTPVALGAANGYRLRNHPNKPLAEKAGAVLDQLRGPEALQIAALITQWTPEIQKPGNLENGKKLFTDNCAACHVYKDEGRNLAPNLTGMGAHGPADLLVHIVDPNRVVEPNFVSVSIETKDELTYDGMIERENNAELVLRNAAGDYTIRKDNIAKRSATGRSLMPEGFEAVGLEGMRDLLAYLCAEDSHYRILDMTRVFTADSSKGIYVSTESRNESLPFRAFGMIRVGDVPFEIISPAKSPTGNNVLVLKGGHGFAKTLAQKVEIPVGVQTAKLHFLGGVGGWAWPYGGDSAKNTPAVKVTLLFRGGGREEIILKNGVEIADYIGSGPNFDVPGSVAVPNVVRRGQVRSFTKEVASRDILEQVVLESFDKEVAPTFIAVTAELPGAPHSGGDKQAAAPAAPAVQALKWAAGPKVLSIGGGSSHDYPKWFGEADSALLAEAKLAVNYSDDPSLIAAAGPVDALLLSLNNPVPAEARKAVFDHVAAGRGLVILHAGNWFNWADWQDFNRQLVTGGTRGHDNYGEFEVSIVDASHPVTQGVPATFTIRDELYNFIPDEKGAERHVLATAKSPKTGKVFPIVWVTKHDKARVVCNTLGHDGAARSNPAYQALLKNSLAWVVGK